MFENLLIKARKARKELQQIRVNSQKELEEELKSNKSENLEVQELPKDRMNKIAATNSRTVRKMSRLTNLEKSKEEFENPILAKVNDIINGIFQ